MVKTALFKKNMIKWTLYVLDTKMRVFKFQRLCRFSILWQKFFNNLFFSVFSLSDTNESNRCYLTWELVKHLANRLIAVSVKGLDALASNLSNDLYLESWTCLQLCVKQINCLVFIEDFVSFLFYFAFDALGILRIEHACNSLEKDKSA